MSFNDFVKLLYGYNYIFYLVAIIAFTIWGAYNIIDLIFSIIGLSSIGEFLFDWLNIDDELIEKSIGYIGMFAIPVLYIALCNSCYMSEYYN